MSFIYRDTLSPLLSEFAAYSTVYRRFEKVWPKDGKDVYANRLYFYRNKKHLKDKPLKKFLESLGVDFEEFTTERVDSEIKDMWFTLRPEYGWDGSVGCTGNSYFKNTRSAYRQSV